MVVSVGLFQARFKTFRFFVFCFSRSSWFAKLYTIATGNNDSVDVSERDNVVTHQQRVCILLLIGLNYSFRMIFPKVNSKIVAGGGLMSALFVCLNYSFLLLSPIFFRIFCISFRLLVI